MPVKANLDALIEDYLCHCDQERRLSPETLRAYRTDLGQFRNWFAGNACELSRETIRAYLSHLNAHYAPASARRKLASLRALASFLRDERILATDPFDGLKLQIREPKRLPRTVLKSDMIKLFNHMGGNGYEPPSGDKFQIARDRAVIELLIATGMRVSELCSLDVNSVDLVGRAVRVDGKGGKERVIQLEDPRTIGALERYLNQRDARELGNEQALLLNRTNGRLSSHGIRDILRNRCDEAGIMAHITPHMFRHTFATWLLESDVDIRYIQRLLGHSSLRTTEIYTHVTSAKLRQIMRDSNPRGMIGA